MTVCFKLCFCQRLRQRGVFARPLRTLSLFAMIARCLSTCPAMDNWITVPPQAPVAHANQWPLSTL